MTPTSSMAVGMVWGKSELLVRGRDLADSATSDRTFNIDVLNGREVVTIRP